MSTKGEFYKETRNTSKDRTDRYRGCKVLEDEESGDLLLSTREILPIKESNRDIYHRVASNEVGRLDKLANQYYNNPLLWWVIAQANNIRDPFAPISPGTLLRIPPVESLYGTSGILL